MIIRFLFLLLMCTLFCSGCNLIYKQNIQQGNAIEQDDLDELYVGMNERQVLFVLGTPSVKDPFHPDRWDYVQTFSRRGNDPVQRTVTLRFKDGLLTEIDGQTDPFGTNSSGGSNEVASFVKKTPTDTEVDSDGTSSGSPQDEALESARDEVLKGVDPDIEAINERNAEDRDYQRDMEMLDQTPDDLSTPDIDG
jgi:outer membrane protein assembly factor BamE